MADEESKRKIRDVVKQTYLTDPDDLVDVSDGPGDSSHLVIVSHTFNGKRMREKNDLIWSVLVQHFSPEEWGKISLSVGTSPEEIKAPWTPPPREHGLS